MNKVLACSGYEVIKKDLVRAHGCYLYDNNDKRYIDFEAGVWCMALGHNHWRINQTIKTQLDRISHIGYRYTTAIVEEAAAEILDSLSLQDGKCVFLCSGSEVVEFGVQVARSMTKKPLLLALSELYLAAYGSAGEKRIDEWYVLDWRGCVDCQLSRECEKCPLFNDIPFDKIGGLVFEPGNASGLVRFPPKQLVQNLVTKVKKHQGLIMVDEVTTGLGRTGKWYGFQHYDLQPDIVALGKALGNGYPVSAIAIASHVADRVNNSSFHYAQSHQDDPMGCAIAREVLYLLREECLIERSDNLGKKFLLELECLKARHSALVKEVRGRGLMIVMDFVSENNSSPVTTVYRQLVECGCLVGCKPSANILRFYPPLTIGEEDIGHLISSLDRVLDTIK